MRTDKKIAIVTGGSRGLGRNTVISLARRGVDSLFTYNSARAEAEKVAAEVEALRMATRVGVQLSSLEKTNSSRRLGI